MIGHFVKIISYVGYFLQSIHHSVQYSSVLDASAPFKIRIPLFLTLLKIYKTRNSLKNQNTYREIVNLRLKCRLHYTYVLW